MQWRFMRPMLPYSRKDATTEKQLERAGQFDLTDSALIKIMTVSDPLNPLISESRE